MKKKILIAFIAMSLSLALAEVVIRCCGVGKVKFEEKPRTGWVAVPEEVWIEYHPVLGWYSQKNKTSSLETSNFPRISIHTNSSGFRGMREYNSPKPAGVIRMAALGDSFVFGFGVEDDQAFPAILESQTPGREVMNIGIPGYGIDQIYLSYREIAKAYHPDIVLIGIFPEDFWRATRSFADTGHVKPYFSLMPNGKLKLHNVPVPSRFSLNKDQFPSLRELTTLQKLLHESVLYRLAKRSLMKLSKNLRLIDPDSTEEWLIGREILHHLIADIRRDGSVPVLILMPPQDWATSARKTSLEKSILRFAGIEKVKMINLKPVFLDAVAKDGLETYYIKNDWHWTPKGHQLAARTIEQSF